MYDVIKQYIRYFVQFCTIAFYYIVATVLAILCTLFTDIIYIFEQCTHIHDKINK